MVRRFATGDVFFLFAVNILNLFRPRLIKLEATIFMDSYKLRQLFYYKVRHGLLQIATGITKCDGFITNRDRYYKVR